MKILILIDCENNTLRPHHKELLSRIPLIKEGAKLCCAVFCSCANDTLLDELRRFCPCEAKIFVNDGFDETHYSSFIEDIKRFVVSEGISQIFMSANIFSRDIAPVLAQMLSFELFTEVTDIEVSEKQCINLTRPVPNEAFFESLAVEEMPIIATFRPHSFEFTEGSYDFKHEIISINHAVEPISLCVEEANLKQIAITMAERIVAGSRAIKTEEHMQLLYDLAAELSAEVGGTRELVDAGFIRRGRQIGQSGKSVAPKLMFIFGASGQIQFVAGFGRAKTTIAVNKDKKATIFKHVDYGVVADIYDVLPHFINKVKSLKA